MHLKGVKFNAPTLDSHGKVIRLGICMILSEFPDDIPEGRLKGAFESAINSIPKKDLRKELKHDLEKYFTKLQK